LQELLDNSKLYKSSLAYKELLDFTVKPRTVAPFNARLASIQGIGEHPRFLLHDSPREGDLDRMLYEGFLATLHGIHTALGGDDEAPFQYIVTTTTTPPKKEPDLVRMKLCSWPREKMLFGRTLGRNSKGENPTDLFPARPKEDQGDEYNAK
jgi:hypothetical protein